MSVGAGRRFTAHLQVFLPEKSATIPVAVTAELRHDAEMSDGMEKACTSCETFINGVPAECANR